LALFKSLMVSLFTSTLVFGKNVFMYSILH
jgi:hypothetical protein